MSQEEKPKRYENQKKMRAHSFSMEPHLYKQFMSATQERGLNASAVIRRLMKMQLNAWAEDILERN